MKPETAKRIAIFLIPLGIVLGTIDLIRGEWIGVAAMVLLVFSQVLNLWTISRRQGAGKTP